jgi:RNase P subunit RPR2
MRRLRMLRSDLIAIWSRSPRRVELHRKPEMSWSCPKCRARNAATVAPDAEAGKIVDVSCLACGTKHEVSVFSRAHGSGAPMTVGVVWI